MIENKKDHLLVSYKEWEEKLTEEEKDAVTLYTSGYHRALNIFLRNNQGETTCLKTFDESITLLDSAIKKFILKEGVKVYRIEFRELEDLKDILEVYQKGTKIEKKEYLSTSVSKEYCEYLKRRNGNQGLIVEIIGIVRTSVSCAYIKELSHFEEEEELLILRNSNMFVVEEPKVYGNIVTIKCIFL